MLICLTVEECDAAKTVADASSLIHHDYATFSLLLRHRQHSRQLDIADDHFDISAFFTRHCILPNPCAGNVACMEGHNRSVFRRISLTVSTNFSVPVTPTY